MFGSDNGSCSIGLTGIDWRFFFRDCRTNQAIPKSTRDSAAKPPTAPPIITPRLFWLEGGGLGGEVLEGGEVDEGIVEELDATLALSVDDDCETDSGTFKVVVTKFAFSWPMYVNEAVETRVAGVDEHL